MYNLTNGQIPLIGVGGICNGFDCYEKIKSGASLVQLYTSLIYKGPSLVEKIKKELLSCLITDGFKNIKNSRDCVAKREQKSNILLISSYIQLLKILTVVHVSQHSPASF